MSQPYDPYQPYQQYPATTPSSGSRLAAILAHLSAPIAALLSAGSLSLLGPLIVYLVSWLLIVTVVGALIGVPLIIVLFVVSAWCHIKGAVRAADDRPYDYPFQIRVLS